MLEEVKKLGNHELYSCLETIHVKKYDLQESYFTFLYMNAFLDSLISLYGFENVYMSLFKEAQIRRLTISSPYKWMLDSLEKWYNETIFLHPSYIREIYATNLLGEHPMRDSLDLCMLDAPVREAVRILNEKGGCH